MENCAGASQLHSNYVTLFVFADSRYPARCPSVALPGDRIMVEGAWIYIYKGK